MLPQSLILIFLACYCASSEAFTSNYHRRWNINPAEDSFLHAGTLFATDAVTYPKAFCRTIDQKTERVCEIVLVTPQRKDRVCKSIKIFAEKGRKLFFNGFFQLTPFTKDHVAVGWYTEPDGPEAASNHSSIQVSLLNINNCKSAYLSFPVDKTGYGFFPSVVYYNRQVDVVVNSKEACKGETKCKLSFDLNGKQIGGVQPYLPAISQYASPVSAKDPSKGFFVHSQDLNSLTVLLVDKNGKEKQLSAVNFEPEASEQDRLLAFSNAHELYSICRMHNSTSKPTSIDCAQYDSNGKITANASIPLEKSANWLAVRSVSNGEILIATSSASDEKEPTTFRTYVIRGNEVPKKPYEPEVIGLKCKDQAGGLEFRISENVLPERREMCFDFSCLPDDYNLDYYTTCISQDILPF